MHLENYTKSISRLAASWSDELVIASSSATNYCYYTTLPNLIM